MKRFLGAALALLLTFTACGDSSAKVDVVIFAEVNQSIINTLRLGGPNCDMSGYDLEILDEKGQRVAGEELGNGIIDSSGIFCGFLVRLKVPVMDEYRVFIPVHSGDTKIVAKRIAHQDVVLDDGTIDIEVKWFNQRDDS